MAALEQRGNCFRVIFRYQGHRYAQALHTGSAKTAAALKGGIEKTLHLLEQRLLVIPPGADVTEFILSGGTAAEPLPAVKKSLTLQDLANGFRDAHGIGAMEQNSLNTVMIHFRHLQRVLGETVCAQSLTGAKLQSYINTRATKQGIRGKRLSPATLRKEMASLRAAWNWGVRMELLTGPFPGRHLIYPKSDEKPPFQTRHEIDRQIAVGGLSQKEQRDLWDSLFLTLPEVGELLAFVKNNARHGFLYPMFYLAAHTGARRSELLRAQVRDADVANRTIVLHEKKRTKGCRTTRRVPLTDLLVSVLEAWIEAHPGSPYLFCQDVIVPHSCKQRLTPTPITRTEAHHHFQRTLEGSKWAVLRGWHVLRHSFISNAVARGVDQRILDRWVGHTTEAMRKRYTHLIPSHEQEVIASIFG